MISTKNKEGGAKKGLREGGVGRDLWTEERFTGQSTSMNVGSLCTLSGTLRILSLKRLNMLCIAGKINISSSKSTSRAESEFVELV